MFVNFFIFDSFGPQHHATCTPTTHKILNQYLHVCNHIPIMIKPPPGTHEHVRFEAAAKDSFLADKWALDHTIKYSNMCSLTPTYVIHSQLIFVWSTNSVCTNELIIFLLHWKGHMRAHLFSGSLKYHINVIIKHPPALQQNKDYPSSSSKLREKLQYPPPSDPSPILYYSCPVPDFGKDHFVKTILCLFY